MGQKETPNNSGFYDKEFEKKMHGIGWQKNYPWCASVVRLIYTEAVKSLTEDPIYIEALNKLYHSVIRTWYSTVAEPWYHTMNPILGSIICFSTGKGKGHMAICEEVIDSTIIGTLEGNTNKAGSREGEWYLQKSRVLDHKNPNWKYLGCITLNFN